MQEILNKQPRMGIFSLRAEVAVALGFCSMVTALLRRLLAKAHMWFVAFRRPRPTATLSGQWLPQLRSHVSVLRSPISGVPSPVFSLLSPVARSHVQNVVVVVAVSVFCCQNCASGTDNSTKCWQHC